MVVASTDEAIRKKVVVRFVSYWLTEICRRLSPRRRRQLFFSSSERDREQQCSTLYVYRILFCYIEVSKPCPVGRGKHHPQPTQALASSPHERIAAACKRLINKYGRPRPRVTSQEELSGTDVVGVCLRCVGLRVTPLRAPLQIFHRFPEACPAKKRTHFSLRCCAAFGGLGLLTGATQTNAKPLPRPHPPPYRCLQTLQPQICTSSKHTSEE